MNNEHITETRIPLPLEIQMSDESPIENAVCRAMDAERFSRGIERLIADSVHHDENTSGDVLREHHRLLDHYRERVAHAIAMSAMWVNIANAAANNGLEDWNIGRLGNFDGASPSVGIGSLDEDTDEADQQTGTARPMTAVVHLIRQ